MRFLRGIFSGKNIKESNSSIQNKDPLVALKHAGKRTKKNIYVMDSKWDPCNIPACIYHRNQPNAGKYTIIWILYKEVVPSFLKSGVSFLKHCCNGSNLKVYQTCQLQPIKQAVVSSSKFHWHHFVHMFCAKQKTSWQMVPSLKQPSEPPW